MAAPAYDSISFQMAANVFSASLALAQTAQGLDLPNDSWALPGLGRHRLTAGTGAGNLNVMTKLYATANAGVTGNTDYDLTTLLDPLGNAISVDSIKYIVVYNFATTAGYNLLIDGTVVNAWLAPFNAISTAKLVIPPGWSDGATVPTVTPGLFILGTGSSAGLAVGPTSKVLRLAAGANTIPHIWFGVGTDV